MTNTVLTYNKEDMLRLSILCGMPLTGKTSFSERVKNKGSIVISLKDVRAECGGDTADTWAMVLFMAKNILSQGQSVVIDATNYNRKSRKTWAQLARRHKAIFEVIYFPADKADVVKQAEEFPDVVRERVTKAISLFVPPLVKECDILYTIRKDGDLYEATVEGNEARGHKRSGRVQF